MKMQQQSNPQPGIKRLRQQQLQRGGSSVDRGGGDKRQQRFWPCPICNRSFSLFLLEDHVNQCLDNSPPFPPTSRSSSLTTGDSSCKTSVAELFPERSVQGLGNVHRLGFERAALTRQQDAHPVATEKDSIQGVNLRQSFNHNTFSPSRGEVVQHSRLQRSTLDREQDGLCLPTEGFSFLEDKMLSPPSENALSDSKVKVVLCSGLPRFTIDRQHDADCLRAERRVSSEDGLLQPPKELVVDEGQEGLFLVEEDWEGTQLRVELEYSGNNESGYGTAALLGKDSWTGDVNDDGPDEQGMTEEGRDGSGSTMDRPPPGFKLFQRQMQSQARLSMFRNFSSAPLERKRSVAVLQPGMVLFRSWLDLETQQKFVLESQGVSHLFRRPTTSGGGKYHIYSMSWGPQYDTKAHRYAGKGPERPIPSWMFELAQKLARDAQQHTPVYPVGSAYAPDVGLVNFYPVKADELGVIGLGGHQDLDDSSAMPVVSVSIGDSMTFFHRRFPPFSRRKSGVQISVDEEAFRFCKDGDAAHNREHQILLESGDVLVFGGKSRLVYHGTRHVQAGTRPPGLHMVPGRLNFTFRQTSSKTPELGPVNSLPTYGAVSLSETFVEAFGSWAQSSTANYADESSSGQISKASETKIVLGVIWHLAHSQQGCSLILETQPVLRTPVGLSRAPKRYEPGADFRTKMEVELAPLMKKLLDWALESPYSSRCFFWHGRRASVIVLQFKHQEPHGSSGRMEYCFLVKLVPAKQKQSWVRKKSFSHCFAVQTSETSSEFWTEGVLFFSQIGSSKAKTKFGSAFFSLVKVKPTPDLNVTELSLLFTAPYTCHQGI